MVEENRTAKNQTSHGIPGNPEDALLHVHGEVSEVHGTAGGDGDAHAHEDAAALVQTEEDVLLGDVMHVRLRLRLEERVGDPERVHHVLRQHQLRHRLVREAQSAVLRNIKPNVYLDKQAGNGIRWRDIPGSKIAKGLQSVKHSLLQYPKNPNIGPNSRARRGTPFGIF